MKNILFVMTAILLISIPGWSASSSNLKDFQTHVFFGDKTAQFRIWSNKSSRHYSATMPDTKIKNGRLSKKDYQFYVKMASEAALEASNDPTFCPRNQIAMDYILKGQKVQKIGCIGSPSPVAKRLVSLANALQFLK